MFTLRAKGIMIGVLSVYSSVLLLVFGCIGMAKGCDGLNCSQMPIKSLYLRVDKSQREELFDQLQKFADKHDFQTQVSDLGTGGENFQFYMSRKDIIIKAGDAPPDPTDVRVSFYPYPGQPVDENTFDDLFDDLKTDINEIPNVTMTEVRKSLRITLDKSQREELFAQMRKLADEHSLEFTLSLSTDKSVFHIKIYGKDFHITSDPVTRSPKEVSITFFMDYAKAPTSTSLETVDELFDELKNLLSEIPNVTIAEEK